ncbi:nucleostemin 1 isoform X2 [Oratosquilla oratoria]
MPCSKRYKIERKVREHNRKLRKDQKKHPDKFKRKDPGVPNSLPFKDKVLEEAAEAKRLQEEAREKRREEAKLRRQEQKDQILNKKRNIGDITQYIQDAETRGAEFEKRQQELQKGSAEGLSDRSAKTYYKEFKKVIDAADIILEVLDARDPLGSRCPQMESTVTSQPNKKLVLVLNKVDLVPRENTEQWLKYLRREHPTVVFKSSTQTQNNRISQVSNDVLKSSSDLLQSSRCLGADVLMQLLKNYCRNKGIKTAICVGVVGLPNVGKSSLINSLKRSKACGVGSTPGFTKNMQEVHLDSKVRLLDCPGIILPGGDTANDAAAALRNAVKVEQLQDPVKPVQAIVARADNQQLMIHYRLEEFKDTNEFLVLLAKKRGKLKKGGVPDVELMARSVLNDWNMGRIKYYTKPPEITDTQVSVTLTSELAKEFDIDSLQTTEGSLLSTVDKFRPSETMEVGSFGPLTDVKEMEEEMDGDEDSDDYEEEEEEYEDDDDMEEDEVEEDNVLSGNVKVEINTTKPESTETEKKERWETKIAEFDPATISLKKYQKKMQKKARKEKSRNVKRMDDLADVMTTFGGLKDKAENDDYDFNDYFEKK